MTPKPRTLTLLPEDFAICRLEPDAPIPAWATPSQASFFSISHSQEELSLICPQQHVPAGVSAHLGWRCFKLEGPFELEEPGILAALVNPLAEAGIAVFAEATFDTDYLLINKLELAISALESIGHKIIK